MRRRYLIKGSKNNNIVYYTTIDNNTINVSMGAFNVVILSNIYDEMGIITCKGNITVINNQAFYNCTNLTSIEIPNSVTSIGNLAFSGCSNLTSIEIPNSVTSIGDGAFRYCESLTSIEIPNNVTSIGSSMFYQCSSLTSIEIPNSVTSIGNWAFYQCSSLMSVYVKSTTPPTLGYSVFNLNASDRKIYVPRASLDIYKTASGWREYASAIEPYDF